MANATMRKFGHPDSLVCDYEQWALLVRPAQVTLGSLVLAAKSDATAFSELPRGAFAELASVVPAIETALKGFSAYERINYLMLMMVDPNVHFHVIPRYSQAREWNGRQFADGGWPGPPQLKLAVELTKSEMRTMVGQLKQCFSS